MRRPFAADRQRRSSRCRAIAPSWRWPPPTADRAGRSRCFRAKRRRGIRPAASLGITYGTWRRVVDDAKYPDIAQEAGIIAVDPASPAIAAVDRRPRIGLGRSVAVLVAERQVDRVPLAPGSVRRYLAAAGGGRQRRRDASVFSAVAPKPAGRAGRPTASGCCSTAPAARRTDR